MYLKVGPELCVYVCVWCVSVCIFVCYVWEGTGREMVKVSQLNCCLKITGWNFIVYKLPSLRCSRWGAELSRRLGFCNSSFNGHLNQFHKKGKLYKKRETPEKHLSRPKLLLNFCTMVLSHFPGNFQNYTQS